MKPFRHLMKEAGGAPPRAMRDADDFWSDFRARAGMCAREAAPTATATALRWAAYASPLAAAALALLLLRPLAGAWAQSDTVINELEVETAYRAVFIMNNESTKSTIVWVDWGQGTSPTGGRL